MRRVPRPRRRTVAGPNPYGYHHQQQAKRLITPSSVCWICGYPARQGDPLHLDHVIPRSLGGSEEDSNKRPAHMTCNIRKGGRNRLRTKR